MANERQENKPAQNTQNADDKIRRGIEGATEQTRRIGLAAAGTSEEAVKTGADLLQQNAEILQNAWRFAVEMATTIMGHSTDHVGRALGVSGDETQQATKRSARNAEGILYSATAVSKGMNDISREYLQLARTQIENSLSRMNELWSCRTPQDFAAVQTDLVRETLERALESSRKVADMSLKVADDAKTQMADRMTRAA